MCTAHPRGTGDPGATHLTAKWRPRTRQRTPRNTWTLLLLSVKNPPLRRAQVFSLRPKGQTERQEQVLHVNRVPGYGALSDMDPGLLGISLEHGLGRYAL